MRNHESAPEYSLISSRTIKLFLQFLFITHIIHAVLVFSVMGYWDGPLSLGNPFGFYKIGCGMIINLEYNKTPICNLGFNAIGLLLNMIFWYIISILSIKWLDGKKIIYKIFSIMYVMVFVALFYTLASLIVMNFINK